MTTLRLGESKIGVENEGGSYRLYLKLIKEVKHPAVGATLDLGHCAYFKEIVELKSEKVEALNNLILRLILELREDLVNLHVHNVAYRDSVDFTKIPYPYWTGDLIDHRSLETGLIDYVKVCEALKDMGYKGFYVIELEEPEAEKKAIKTAEILDKII